MIPGYAGKLLRVDLTTGTAIREDLNEDYARRYIGGRGLAARYLYEVLQRGVPDPLGPDNVLFVMSGPLTANPVICCQRYDWTTVSPLTGIYLCSSVGGRLGREVKRAGFDGLAITGRAPAPCYLLISEGQVTLEDATDLWGLSVSQTTERLLERHPDHAVACIGPAGEQLVKLASIADEGRSAGRGGGGAVMGSKNLKAVVARGWQVPTVADPRGLQEAVGRLREAIAANPVTAEELPTVGSLTWLSGTIAWRILPARNFQQLQLHEVQLSPQAWREKHVSRDLGCTLCPIRHAKVSEVREGPWRGYAVQGPEFETTWALGVNCGIEEYPPIIAANSRCDDLGLDTMSCGNVIGFALECAQRGFWNGGLLGPGDGDLDLAWGNAETVVRLVEKIGRREPGLGELLGQGVRQVAREVGQGSEDFACHVKGLEMPAYEPRGVWGMGLTYATACRGACHLKSWTCAAEMSPDYEPNSIQGKAALVKNIQDFRAVLDSGVACVFASRALAASFLAEFLTCVTGWEIHPEEVALLGARIYDLERAAAIACGVSRREDSLPPRFFTDPVGAEDYVLEPIPQGQFEQMLDEYYDLRGWDRNGVPPPQDH